jgi:uncharacterized damage-inducible protein DinB
MEPGISFRELLGWLGEETTRYERWFATKPAAAWTVPAGEDRVATVRDLLFHTYYVDLRMGRYLHGEPVPQPTDISAPDAPALFALAREGQALLTHALATIDLDQMVDYQTRAHGVLRISRRKIFAHSITHHLRHTAQVATLLRQGGFATDWLHDLLMSGAMV